MTDTVFFYKMHKSAYWSVKFSVGLILGVD